MSHMKDKTSRPVYVIDSPRTCSQVFGKLRMAHPKLKHIFMSTMGPSFYGPDSFWRGRKLSDDTVESYTSLTESANASQLRMFSPTTYEEGANKVEQDAQEILEKVYLCSMDMKL